VCCYLSHGRITIEVDLAVLIGDENWVQMTCYNPAARPSLLGAHQHLSKARNPPMAHLPDAQHAPIAELVHELDRLAVDVMADWKVPGAALAVVKDDEVIFHQPNGTLVARRLEG
jgi:CubicO group peptidase (beta-lactamase class C family)